MPQLRLGAALCAAALLCAGARPARAQGDVPPTVADCDVQRLLQPAPADLDPLWRVFHPTELLTALDPQVKAGDWLAVLDEVRASLDRADVRLVPSSPQADASLARFRNRQDSVRARLARFLDLPEATRFAEALDDARRLGPSMFRTELRLGEAFLFRGTSDAIVLSDSSPQALRRAVCYHAAVERTLLDRFTLPARQAAAAILTAKRARWESYFSRGYSQLPWELYINSRAARSAGELDPPTTQWIVAHPSVAVQLSGPSYRDLARHDAIALEPLGYLWYRNGFRDYFGLSSAVVFTNGAGTGIGPFLHFGRVAKVGYVVPTRRGGVGSAQRTGGVLISVDLYKYLSDRSAQVEGALNRAKAALEKAVASQEVRDTRTPPARPQ